MKWNAADDFAGGMPKCGGGAGRRAAAEAAQGIPLLRLKYGSDVRVKDVEDTETVSETAGRRDCRGRAVLVGGAQEWLAYSFRPGKGKDEGRYFISAGLMLTSGDDRPDTFTITVRGARVVLDPGYHRNRVAAIDITIKRESGGDDLVSLNSLRFHFIAPTGVAYEGDWYSGVQGICSHELALAPNGSISCTVYFKSPDGYFGNLRGAIDGEIVFEPGLRDKVRAPVRLVAGAEE